MTWRAVENKCGEGMSCTYCVCRQPIYSLGARLEGAGKATRTPGPAAYPPNLYNVKKVIVSPTPQSNQTFQNLFLVLQM